MPAATVLPDGYSFAACELDDLDQFQRAFSHAVGKQKPLAYFEYNHCANPIGPPVREKLLYRGQIVGSHTIRQALLSVAGRTVRAGLTMDSFIHPEHRQRGLFSILAQHTTNIARQAGIAVMLGFANQNSIHAYKKYLGHSEPGALRCVSVDNGFATGSQQFALSDHHLTDRHRQIISRDIHREKFACSFVKDPDYVHWRYLASPESRYLFLSDEHSFVGVLKQYQDQLQLVDIFLTSHADAREALQACINLAADQKHTLSMWLAAQHPMAGIIAEFPNRVLPGAQHLHIACYDSQLRQQVLDLGNWHYVMGDSDVF